MKFLKKFLIFYFKLLTWPYWVIQRFGFKKILTFIFKFLTWPYWVYRYYDGWSINKVLCPNCNKWTGKEIINNKQFLGEGTKKVMQRDVHVIRKGFYNQDKTTERFEHEYYIDKKVNEFKVTYNCNCCNKPFTINEKE
jgi:hypothetical protein